MPQIILRWSRLPILALLIWLGFGLTQPVHAGTINVPCNVSSLRTAVQNATSGDTLELASGCTYTFTTGATGSTSNALPLGNITLTINGHGAIIQRSTAVGTPNFRLFYVPSGGNLTLNNLTLRQGKIPGSFGGGIRSDGGPLTLNQVTVSNNSADWGGGIYANGSGLVTLTNSTVTDNTATSGGGGGISIYQGNLTLNTSTISNNTAYAGGGIDAGGGGYVQIYSSTITGNSADTAGGGFYNFDDDGYLDTTTVSNNSASYGGGIYNGDGGTLGVYSGAITGNTAANSETFGKGRGSGVYNSGYMGLGYLTISDNTSAGDGGGVYNAGSGTTNTYFTDFTNNEATLGFGGAIWNSVGTTNIWNTSSFTDNRAGIDGGAIANFYNGTVAVDHTTFTHNTASTQGGAIANEYGSVTVSFSDFTNNSTSNYAGAISNGGIGSDGNPGGVGTLDVSYTTFTGNSATVTGGAIANNYGSSATLTKTTFKTNSANNGGGVSNSSGTVTIKDSEFSSNTANNSGASISNLDKLDVDNTFFTSETATGPGGSIQIFGGTATIKNSFFAYNSGYDGGAVNAVAGTLHIYDTQFYVNTAHGNGGGIQAMGTSTMTLKGGNIAGNTADSGGGLLSTDSASVSIDGTTFYANRATSNGGGLNTYSGSMSIINSTFNNNSAAYGGGINTYGGGHVTVSSTIFGANGAATQGGGLNSGGNSVLKVNESCILANSAPQGGGIFNANATALDAISNWWGHSTGPSGNAFGSGDNISANVNYVKFKSIAPDRCIVLTAPANDLLEAPANVTSLPTNLTIDPRGATVNFNEPNLSCAANRTDSVWYKYTPSASKLVTIDTSGSEYDTALAVYTGGYAASFANFVQVGCNDNPASGQQAKLQAYMEAGKTYFIQVVHVGTSPLTDEASHLHLNLFVVNTSVSMTVIPQGRPTPPSPLLVMQLHVVITPQGGGTPVFDQVVTTDQNGQFLLDGVTPGNYHLWLKGENALAVSKDVTLVAGNNNVDLPTPPTGDTDGNNVVNLTDFSILATTFGKQNGNTGYDGRADFNGDSVVNLTDFSLLATSFGKSGAP
jgi:predicted outer membrane repeat protein